VTRRLGRRSLTAFVGWAGALACGCGGWAVGPEADAGAAGATGAEGGAAGADAGATDAGDAGRSPVDYPRGFRVVGNRIEDADGNRVFLRGVNHSGTEYKCVQGAGFFEGPADDVAILAMKSWGLNAVRIPLNETCWLALNGIASRYSGEPYRSAIVAYVERLHRHGLVPILDLHWSAPGDGIAGELTPMPNADHSEDFWRSVATTFLDDDGVIFEPFNEPFPDFNRDTPEAWACWRDGCDVGQYGTEETYEAAGMQSMVDAIRETGSKHLVLLGGIQYSNELSGWLAHKPNDPENNLAAAWHVYNNNECSYLGCWNEFPAEVAASFPIIATEIGQNDCEGDTMLKPLMQFLDEHASGYLPWSWHALGECVPTIPRMQQGAPWSLITNYTTPQPNSAYAQTFYDHVQEVGR
jgi:hypothetical protein